MLLRLGARPSHAERAPSRRAPRATIFEMCHLCPLFPLCLVSFVVESAFVAFMGGIGMMSSKPPLVGIIMGSKSDWDAMRQADEILTRFDVPHESRVMSAHRTPALTTEYASQAVERGLEVIIAGAGGAAHLAGVVAAHTVVPVIGVPMQSALNGLDSLLSTVQMPKGVPVATVAIGPSGAANAGLLAVAILANSRPELRARLLAYRNEIADQVRDASLP
jgi:5-(carboxyamino)imidazole ribonucleotide mutase